MEKGRKEDLMNSWTKPLKKRVCPEFGGRLKEMGDD